MKLNLKKGTTSKLLDIFIQDSSSTVGAGLTGLVYNTASLTAYYYREGAASATAITLATMTLGTWATGGFVVIDGTNMAGCYQLSIPDAALATGANSVIVMLKGATNMAPLVLEIELVDNVEADTYAIANHATYGNAQLNTDLDTLLTRIVGTLLTGNHNPQTGDSFARLGAPVGASISADVAGVQSDTDNIQTRIPTALVGGRIDASVGAVAANAITAAAIADGAIDRATFAADTGLQNIRANTAQAGAATTITLDASASAVDSFYNECWVYITGGTGVGQTRAVTAYVGATKVATITPNWITTPDATSTFAIWGVSRNDAIASGTTDWSTAEKNQIRQALGVDGTKAATSAGNINTVMADTDDIQTRLPAALVTGRMDSSVGSNLDKTGYALTQAFPTNFASLSITAAGLVDITQAAADKAWSTAARTLTSFGTLISDMWANATRTITGGTVTTNSDKTGYSLSSAGIQAIWDALTSVLTTVGSIGKLLVDNINATISSRSTITTAQVNTEVVDALATDTYAEPTAVIAATSSLKDKINWLFCLGRNKVTQTATTQTLRNDADAASIATSTHSDDGTTHTKGEWI